MSQYYLTCKTFTLTFLMSQYYPTCKTFTLNFLMSQYYPTCKTPCLSSLASTLCNILCLFYVHLPFSVLSFHLLSNGANRTDRNLNFRQALCFLLFLCIMRIMCNAHIVYSRIQYAQCACMSAANSGPFDFCCLRTLF